MLEIVHDYRLDFVAFVGFMVATALIARRRIPGMATVRRHARWVWAGIVMLALVGGGCAEHFGNQAQAKVVRTAQSFAAFCAYEMQSMGHARIGLDTAPEDAHYLEMIEAEKAWLRLNTEIDDIYTYRRLPDGRFVYLVDSETDYDRNGRYEGPREARTPIGALHRDPDAWDERAAAGEAVFNPRITEDEWGTWVSAIQPMYGSDGNVEALLGVDIAATAWLIAPLRARFVVLSGFSSIYLLLSVAAYSVLSREWNAHRDEVENRLRESENRFRSLFENIPNIAVQGYDRERRVIFWNTASEIFYGYPRAEAFGRRLEDLIIPESMQAGVRAAVDRWIATGEPIPSGELVLRSKDGRPVSVFSSHVMQRNGRGEPEMYCVDIDLTERDRASAALRASEEHYRTLFEILPLPACVYDPETLRILAANQAATTRYGYTHDEALGLTLLDIVLPAEHARLHQMMGSSSPKPHGQRTEWYHRTKCGSLLYAEVTARSLLWLGRQARLLVVNDVTARKAAERRIGEQAELLDKTSEAIIVADLENRITYWNRAAEQLFGYKADMIVGRRLVDIELFGWTDRMRELYRAATTTMDQFREELKLPGGETGHRYIEISVTLIRNDVGMPQRRLAICSDITKRKALEAQFFQAHKTEIIGRLAGGVAHDFNNILMAMTLTLDMLQEDVQQQPSPASAVANLQLMTSQASNLTRQLLLFARKQAVHPQTLDLNAALINVATMLRRLIGADVQLDLAVSDQPVWVEVDMSMLDQVIMNLCLNARDAMPDGGCLRIATAAMTLDEATASTMIGARPGRFATMTVQDTGTGIAEDVLPHIFEPFFTTKPAGVGTGLGLATVQGIVQLHRGWINVHSSTRQGTTFLVYFPLADPPAAAATKPAPGIRGGTERILLVDDDQNLRTSCAATLRRLGYRVQEAVDGADALRLWHASPDEFDLLLSDIVMPRGINGLDLAERIRKHRPHARIVLMSGFNKAGVDDQSLAAQGILFIRKPAPAAQLNEIVRRALEAPAPQD